MYALDIDGRRIVQTDPKVCKTWIMRDAADKLNRLGTKAVLRTSVDVSSSGTLRHEHEGWTFINYSGEVANG